MDRIQGVLEGARQGQGGALLLLGEPGIGKTTLLAEARALAADMRVASAAGFESEAQLPFAALGEVAEPLLDGLADLPEPRRLALGAALALTAPPDLPGDRFAIFAALLSLLRSAAAQRPLVLLLDDAHWFDLPSSECFGYVARRLEGSPIALLAAARPGEGRAALEGRMPAELTLGGLGRLEALSVLHDVSDDLALTVADELADLAVGNPLALRELPGTLTEGQRRGRAPLDPLPAPTGLLRDAFERRLAATPPDARAALLVAAAAADRALAPVVAACAELGIDAGALQRAEADALIDLSPDQLTFAHPLLRAVVYDEADAADRRAAHRALATHSSEDAGAWHLAAAAVGPDPQAAGALEAAARRATGRGAHGTAADALERAAQASADPAARSMLLLQAAGAAGLGAAYDRAASLLEPVAEIENAAIRAPARHLLGLVTLVGGSRPGLSNHAMLSEEAERIGDVNPSLAALLHADAGITAVVAGECNLALASAERAAEVVPDGAGEEIRCHVQAMLGMGLALRGMTAEAREAYDRAAALLPSVHPLSPSAQSVSFALHARICTGQERELRSEALSFGSTGRDAGTVGLLPHYLLVAADAAYRLGEWDAAAEESAEAVAIADDSGQHGPLSIALVIQGRLHAARGGEDEARAAIGHALEIAEPPGYHSTGMWAHAALGFMELGLGRPEAAITELEESRSLAESGGLRDPLIVPWAPDLVEAYVQAGHTDAARTTLALLRERALASGTTLALALAARAEGLVADEGFEARFHRALELHDDAEAPFERGRTLLAYGLRLHRARRRVAARERLREAAECFRVLGARPWVTRTRAELRAAGAVERRSAVDPDELTAQEIRVARAVARGATNREVAGELFLSPKTIEFHLGRVYRKLGIRSRTELATLVAEGALDQAGAPVR